VFLKTIGNKLVMLSSFFPMVESMKMSGEVVPTSGRRHHLEIHPLPQRWLMGGPHLYREAHAESNK
jgi:hypothetical protein